MSRVLRTKETYEIAQRGTAWVVEVGESEEPYELGEIVLLDGVEMEVVGREMQPTSSPRYVIRGHMSLLLRPVP